MIRLDLSKEVLKDSRADDPPQWPGCSVDPFNNFILHCYARLPKKNKPLPVMQGRI